MCALNIIVTMHDLMTNECNTSIVFGRKIVLNKNFAAPRVAHLGIYIIIGVPRTLQDSIGGWGYTP